MGMLSEIAVEAIVKNICLYIEKSLLETTDKEKQSGLKQVGRHALTLFDWSRPDWASRYSALFEETL